MASRACLVAVNRVIRAAGIDEDGVHAATIALARDLARRVDKVGVDDAPLNLLRLYDSALTKLQRAVKPQGPAKRVRESVEPVVDEPPAPAGPPALRVVEESPLEKLRKKKQQRSA